MIMSPSEILVEVKLNNTMISEKLSSKPSLERSESRNFEITLSLKLSQTFKTQNFHVKL